MCIRDRAKDSGFRVVSLEDSGEVEPWEEDLTGDVILVVGGERDGIPRPILEKSDSVVRVPMSGFVPSYNLQAPMAVVAAEALRQRREVELERPFKLPTDDHPLDLASTLENLVYFGTPHSSCDRVLL